MKKILSLILTVLMSCTMILLFEVSAFAQTEDMVQFYRWNEFRSCLEPDFHDGCIVANDDLKDIGNGYAEWVIVNDKIQIDELYVHGEANIILASGGELITEMLYGCNRSNLLHIYGTSSDGNGGTLRITGGDLIAINSIDLDLCGGSVIVEEGYVYGFVGNELAVHGGFISTQGDDKGVCGLFHITGGNAEINNGLFGDLLMEGGNLKITAWSFGIIGNASVSGGTLEILAGDIGVYDGVLTINKGTEWVHIAVCVEGLSGNFKSPRGIGVKSICENYIFDDVGNFNLFINSNNGWYNLGSISDSLTDKDEVLILSTDSEIPDIKPVGGTGSIISKGYPEILFGVGGLAVGFVAAMLIFRKKNKKTAVAEGSVNDSKE